MKNVPRPVTSPCHLFRPLVDSSHNGVVTLEGLKGKLFLRLQTHLPHFLDFLCEYNLGLRGTVDTVGLDGDEHTTADLEEEACVETDDTCLI